MLFARLRVPFACTVLPAESPSVHDAPFASERDPELHERFSGHRSGDHGKRLQGRARAGRRRLGVDAHDRSGHPSRLPGSDGIYKAVYPSAATENLGHDVHTG